ncbi:AI-2E family transporter [Lautropia dentalis]|uniref:AI-2E family transporter n=1 Tax=Lautropia dentalis TaxID=2490857 RepID=A0A3R8MQL6_9BURK|nr:AI-2E family transporter [Lautropia dentalis]RRN44185.1 AI-2E family transporter [Lautropia dentalis]
MPTSLPALLPVLGLLATAVAAFVIILKGLVIPVLLALLVYAWSCLLADRIVQAHRPMALSLGYYPNRWPAVLSGVTVCILVITAFVFLTYWTIHLASSNDLRVFLVRIEDSLEVLRQALPEAAARLVPENWADLKAQLFNFVRSKAAVLSSVGGAVVHTIVQSLFAILVGALAAVSTWQPHRLRSDELFIARLLVVLERVVIAQMRIALFNTTMTALYLFVLLPMFHVQLPFRGLLCMFTLLTGVLPVLGNLMANTVLSLISFAVSPWVAVGSLVFLILIHKLEYVINARTVGSKIHMHSWEILAAMLTGESLFGVPGLVTAPLLYPFFKREIGRIWAQISARTPAVQTPHVVVREVAPGPTGADGVAEE